MGLDLGLFLGLLVTLSGGLMTGLAVALVDFWSGGLVDGLVLPERSFILLLRAGGKLDRSGGES